MCYLKESPHVAEWLRTGWLWEKQCDLSLTYVFTYDPEEVVN